MEELEVLVEDISISPAEKGDFYSPPQAAGFDGYGEMFLILGDGSRLLIKDARICDAVVAARIDELEELCAAEEEHDDEDDYEM
jgi:hypothetical protein